MLGRWGKRVGEATKKAEDLAGNTWQHREFIFMYFFAFCYYVSVSVLCRLDQILQFNICLKTL